MRELREQPQDPQKQNPQENKSPSMALEKTSEHHSATSSKNLFLFRWDHIGKEYWLVFDCGAIVRGKVCKAFQPTDPRSTPKGWLTWEVELFGLEHNNARRSHRLLFYTNGCLRSKLLDTMDTTLDIVEMLPLEAISVLRWTRNRAPTPKDGLLGLSGISFVQTLNPHGEVLREDLRCVINSYHAGIRVPWAPCPKSFELVRLSEGSQKEKQDKQDKITEIEAKLLELQKELRALKGTDCEPAEAHFRCIGHLGNDKCGYVGPAGGSCPNCGGRIVLEGLKESDDG